MASASDFSTFRWRPEIHIFFPFGLGNQLLFMAALVLFLLPNPLVFAASVLYLLGGIGKWWTYWLRLSQWLHMVREQSRPFSKVPEGFLNFAHDFWGAFRIASWSIGLDQVWYLVTSTNLPMWYREGGWPLPSSLLDTDYSETRFSCQEIFLVADRDLATVYVELWSHELNKKTAAALDRAIL